MKYADIDPVAEYQYIKQAFEKLKSSELSEEQYSQAKEKILSLLPFFHHQRYLYTDKKFPFRLFRVRSEKGISADESIEQTATFSYPSPEKCQVERANVEGCPVFYVSDHPETALYEAKVEEGEIVYLSEWQLTAPENACMYLIFTEDIPDNHPWKKVHTERLEQFRQWLADMPAAAKDSWVRLERMYCRAFLEDDYAISSLIGHHLLYGAGKPRVHTLVYPSRAHNETYCNLAMHPDFADQRAQLVSICRLQVFDENLKKSPEVLAVGEIESNTIHWRNPKQGEVCILDG